MGWIISALLFGACIFLVRRNYELEKRWRNLRYCWHMMSDFAGQRLRDEEAEPDCRNDWQWEQVVKEQTSLMKRFGVPSLTDNDIQIYEHALLERHILPLRAHWVD